MKSLAFAVLLVGCQHGDAGSSAPPPPSLATAAAPGARPTITDSYRADLVTICDCVRLSGADKMPHDERWPIIAMWLGPHITTDQAHAFLVEIQPLEGDTKANALDNEARRAGLPSCALSAEWRQ